MQGRFGHDSFHRGSRVILPPVDLSARRGGPSDKCASCGHARSLHRPGGCSPNAVGGHRCECKRFVGAELPNVIPIGTAHDQKVDNRYLEVWGKSTFVRLPFGSVGTISNAKIQVIDASGRSFELTEDDVRRVEEAFARARHAASLWREHITGFNQVRVTRHVGGAIDVTHRGKTHRMRRLRTRSPRRFVHDPDGFPVALDGHQCGACKKRPGGPFYVIANRGEKWNRIRFVEVCEPCVEKLAAVPTAIRAIESAPGRAKAEHHG